MNLNNCRLSPVEHVHWSKEMNERITELYESGMEVEQIAQEMGTPYPATDAHLSWIGVNRNRRLPSCEFKFKGYDRDLAYLVGTYLTDGYSNLRQVGLSSNDLDYTENFARCLETVLGRTYTPHKINSPKSKAGYMWRTVIDSRELSAWLISETGKKNHIPSGIISAPEDIRLSFLAGAMDGDGWMGMYKRHKKVGGAEWWAWSIGFCGAEEFVRQIPEFVRHLEIQPKPIRTDYRGTGHKNMMYCRFNNMSVVHSGFYFGIKRKQDRLQLMREKYLPQRTYAEVSNET
jgi:intein/homing endonuclease